MNVQFFSLIVDLIVKVQPINDRLTHPMYLQVILLYVTNNKIKSTEMTPKKRADKHYTTPPLDGASVKDRRSRRPVIESLAKQRTQSVQFNEPSNIIFHPQRLRRQASKGQYNKLLSSRLSEITTH